VHLVQDVVQVSARTRQAVQLGHHDHKESRVAVMSALS
jgi:hypothetical protein